MKPKRERKPSFKAREMQQLEQIFLEDKMIGRRCNDALSHKIKRQEESPDVKRHRLDREAQAQAVKRRAETTEEKQQRLSNDALSHKTKRQEESPDVKRQRLDRKAQAQAVKRRAETTEEKQQRLSNDALSHKTKRQEESPDVKRQRLDTEAEAQAAKRTHQSREEKQQRLHKDSEAHTRKRRKTIPAIATQVNAADSGTLYEASQMFLIAIKQGPDYPCACCHRLMYKQNVLQLNSLRYKMSETLQNKLWAHEIHRSGSQNFICKTCDRALKRGKLPAQAKANNLDLKEIPPLLSQLNVLETRLISLRIPFMKMVALPSGKQRAIHGPAVNVPTDLNPVCSLLPRLPSESQVVPMKLKRKLCYKGHYIYDYIRPELILNALQWLKINNPLYKDVTINTDWLHQASQDSCELWEAFTSQSSSSTGCDQALQTEVIQKSDNTNSQQHFLHDFNMLQSIAKQKGFIVRNLPSNGIGNCLFVAVEFGLSNLGVTPQSPSALRQQVTEFLRNNPYTSDGSCHLKEFITTPVVNRDGCDADTEQPDEQDELIESLEDTELRDDLRWHKYLINLEQTAWGDHITVQGLANMLGVNIHVISSQSSNIETIPTSSPSSIGDIHIGLVGQYHYFALERHNTTNPAEDNSETTYGSDLQLSSAHVQHTPLNNSKTTLNTDNNLIEKDEDALAKENEEALNDQLQLRGLPYESGLHKETLEESSDNVYSIAPGEGQKPIAILTDDHFEEMCNPTKYPYGAGGLKCERETNISVTKFFNQRLLDCDGRFAKDVEYLLTAQYAVESKQVADEVSIALRQTQGRSYRGHILTVGTLKNQQLVQQMIWRDDAYRFLKNVRGSPAYFQRVMYDVLAMIRQLGLPTWFLTLSAADMQWPDVIQTIARQYGTILTEEQVRGMSFEDKSQWLRQNPVTAARHFQYRLNTFFHTFLKSKANPLGELVDYTIRIEFQARGSPHAHTILWIKDAPKFGEQSDQEVCAFIDRYVKCGIPNDPDLEQIVNRVQKHKHSGTCRRNGKCRFHYPRPPSPCTLIAQEPDPEMCSADNLSKAKEALAKVRKELDNKSNCAAVTLNELLSTTGVSLDTYMNALTICSSGNSVVMQRQPCEAWINTYNPDVLKVWRANMDIQYILDPYACVMYIASYMLKSEKSMGELLKQVSKESTDLEIRAQLRRLGSVFLNHREVSAQEAVYRILSLPLKQLSRKVVFINTDSKPERVSILKSAEQIEHMEDDDENIFQTSLVDRYAARPTSLNDMCLAEFAANYTTRTGKEFGDNESNDTLPPAENDSSTQSQQRIQLANNLGYMYKRKKEAVIRFHKFSLTKEPNKVFRSKLMLYLPWRNEDVDILSGYVSFKARYEDLCEDILRNEQRYSKNANIIQDAVDQLHHNGPPQHAWDTVAPGTEEQRIHDSQSEVEEERTIEQEDLDANAQLFQRQQHTSPLIDRFTTEANRQLMSPEEYRARMRQLNNKQKQIVNYHRKWCKNAVISLRTNKPITPYRIFLSGPGGVGKSHVISLIHNDTIKLLRLSGEIQPSDIIVLLTAPTGVAAFNIQGMTVHSSLLLGTSRTYQPLTQDKLNTLRTKLSKLQLLIIDEVSMVGSNMLLQIHKRLQQLKGTGDDYTFGNISILAVGDLYQLQPVAQSHIFEQASDAYSKLHRSGSLWLDEFSMMQLDEIMRQKEDGVFANLLCRVRTNTCTKEDIDILKSRDITTNNCSYPIDALHVYRLNKDVDEQNITKLNQLVPKQHQVTIKAIDCTKDSHTRQVDITMPSNKAHTGGLVDELHLAVRAKVMLTVNIDVTDGLVNGARGTIESIITTGNNVSLILVKFDQSTIGISAIQRSHYRQQYPHAVPIARHEAVFRVGKNKTVEVSRTQFPLVLSWATTIHKVQGLTLDKIVVDMKGGRFSPGQAYVAFSRVRSLDGLFIKNFNAASIKTSSAIVAEMDRLASICIPQQPPPQLHSLSQMDWLKIGHLNVHSYTSKLPDISHDQSIKCTHIMCFTETFLSPTQNVDNTLSLNGETTTVFRLDRTPSQAQNLTKGGIMIMCTNSLNVQEVNIDHHPLLEVKTILVSTASHFKLYLVTIYCRPQLPVETFLTHLNHYLSHIPYRQYSTVMVGDFNLNLIASSTSPLTDTMSSKGFTQLITTPTTDSGSLLDHIYYNCPHSNAVVEVVDTYYSDHDATFISIPLL